MDFCDRCDKLLRTWSTSPFPHQSLLVWDGVTIEDLIASAVTCRLCDLFVSSPTMPAIPNRGHKCHDWGPRIKDIGELVSGSEHVTVKARLKLDYDNGLSLITMYFHRRGRRGGEVNIATWADEGA